MREKIQRFGALVQQETEARIRATHHASFAVEIGRGDYRVRVHYGSKYARVDVGTSGKYMVDLSTGNIYGIKGYGVVNKLHMYGTVDTTAEWRWDGYVAQRRVVEEK